MNAQDTQRMIDDAQGAVFHSINSAIDRASNEVQIAIGAQGSTDPKAVTTVENSPRILGMTYGGIALVAILAIVFLFARP